MAKIGDILKSYRKSVNSTSVKDSTIAKVTEFLDTGSAAINRVLTGDVTRGIPRGRITDIYGESQSGKSWIAANCAADALKNKGYQSVIYLDSEAGGLFEVLKNKGVDLDKVEHVPVHSTEDATVKLLQLYDQLVSAAIEWKKDPNNNEEPKVLVILDSFGGLVSDKIVSDANKDKTASDMGANAKAKNSLCKALMMRVAESNCPMIIINHIYRNPGALFPSKILEQPGGEGLKFASHVMLQMSKLLIKANDTEFLTGNEQGNEIAGFYKGNRIRAFCSKNRIAKPCFETELYIDFSTGPAKYDGLIEDAVKYGFIQEVRGGYVVPSYSDKKVTYKELVSNDEIWNTFIDKFNEESIKRMSYSNSVSNELDKIEEAERLDFNALNREETT